MNLTENFTLEELTYSATASLKGNANMPGLREIDNLKRLCQEVLQPIRDAYGKPLRVTSAFRSVTLNKAVRGAETSQHLIGEAADIVCDNNLSLWNLICKMILEGKISVGQLIDEKNLKWIHVSLPSSNHLNQIICIK